MKNNKKNYILPNHKEESKRGGEITRSDFVLSEEFKDLGKKKKFFIRTYGCQANVRDSETLSGILTQMGFEPVDSYENADLTIFNTCAVRHAAEEHVLGEIGNLKKFKLEHPESYLCAMWL